jgi:excisionase family DNA binding protein
LEVVRTPDPAVAPPDFAGLAEDLDAAWNAPGVTMRSRQRLLRALVTDIIADIDEAAREVVLTIHWRGGQHSQLRVKKPKSGEHGCRTPEEALAVMRSMATRWSDEDIAASLNRMGMPTGQGKTWTAHRVGSLRRVHGIHAYRSAEKDGAWLTMSEAATVLGVTSHRIRRLIRDGVLQSEQVVPGAPHQIRAADLHHDRVTAAMGRTDRPCRIVPENPTCNVSRYLKKRGTMNASSRSAGSPARRHCWSFPVGRRAQIGRGPASARGCSGSRLRASSCG